MLVKQIQMQLVFDKHYFFIAKIVSILFIPFALEIDITKILILN